MAVGAIIGQIRKDQSYSITIRSADKNNTYIISGNSDGHIRASVSNPYRLLKNNETATDLLYPGKMAISYDLGLKNIINSEVSLHSGNISDDFAHYFVQSEQIPTAVFVASTLNNDGTVKAAKAILIQAMPDCSEKYLTEVETKIKNMKQFSKLIDNYQLSDIIEMIFPKFKTLETYQIIYQCECTIEKVIKTLSMLNTPDEPLVFDTNNNIAVTCEFCKKEYIINGVVL